MNTKKSNLPRLDRSDLDNSLNMPRGRPRKRPFEDNDEAGGDDDRRASTSVSGVVSQGDVFGSGGSLGGNAGGGSATGMHGPYDEEDSNYVEVYPRDMATVRMMPRECDFTPNTWWMIDLDAQPVPSTGATMLAHRCMVEFGWNESHVRVALKAYKQFLNVRAKKRDWKGVTLTPSKTVDKIWQLHIMDVNNYALDCMLLFGMVIGRCMGSTNESEEMIAYKYDVTAGALLEAFKSDLVDQSENGVWHEVFHNGGAIDPTKFQPPFVSGDPADLTNARLFFYFGKWQVVPKEWRFPTCNVRETWKLWLIGDDENGVPPLKTIKSKDIEHLDRWPPLEYGEKRRQVSKNLSDLRFLMKYIERLLRKENQWTDIHNAPNINRMITKIEHHFHSKTPMGKIKRMKTWMAVLRSIREKLKRERASGKRDSLSKNSYANDNDDDDDATRDVSDIEYLRIHGVKREDGVMGGQELVQPNPDDDFLDNEYPPRVANNERNSIDKAVVTDAKDLKETKDDDVENNNGLAKKREEDAFAV